MSDKSLPLFWGYITKSGKLILKGYHDVSQITRAMDHSMVQDVVCPFRAENIIEAQTQINTNYGSFGMKSEIGR